VFLVIHWPLPATDAAGLGTLRDSTDGSGAPSDGQ